MNKTETLSQTDKELIQLIRSADENTKAILMDALICAVSFGDAFLKELDISVKQGDRTQVLATVAKWKKSA